MSGIGQVWQLRRGEDLLGEIRITGSDFPWLEGSFSPQAGFAEVEPLFAAELALSEALMDSDGDDTADAWEAAYERIVSTTTLVSPSGPVPEFLLHIQGREAWFRC